MSSEPVTEAHDQEAGRPTRLRRGVLYPNLYAWYILAATLDIIVTHQILHEFKGSEVNKLADLLIQRYGVVGMIGLKYSSIVLVVLVCEYVGRAHLRLGRRLAIAAIVISSLPVGIGLLQLWAWTHVPMPASLYYEPSFDEEP